MGESEARAGQGGKPLVSVERQTEHDLFTGERVERRFVKMYFEARESGLLADIPDDLWKTLCALATYIDDEGRCFPSQETIARDLGVGRQAVNGRIKRLREYRFQGKAVLAVERPRVRSRKGQSRWGSNVYQLLPIAGFNFGKGDALEKAHDSSMSCHEDIEKSGSMSAERDIENSAPEPVSKSPSMSRSMSPLARHKQERTREEQEETHTTEPAPAAGQTQPDSVCVSFDSGEEKTERRKIAVDLVRRFHRSIGASKGRRPSDRELEHALELLGRHGTECGRFLVGFALREARKTRFSMRHFGAVMSYEADALEAWKAEQQRRVREAQDERRRREEALKDRYYRWRAQVLREAMEAMDASELKAAEANIAAELQRERGRQRFGFDTMVRLNLEERVAAERGIPPFEQWRREDYPKLREAGLA